MKKIIICFTIVIVLMISYAAAHCIFCYKANQEWVGRKVIFRGEEYTVIHASSWWGTKADKLMLQQNHIKIYAKPRNVTIKE